MMRRAALVLFTVFAAALVAPAAAQVATAAKPLVSGPTNWPGVTIDLMSVERKGSIVTVKWAVRNQGAERAGVQFAFTGPQQTTYLLDEESGTKYYALTDKEKNTLASEHVYIGSNNYGINGQVPPGGMQRYWAKFPAPPAAVKAINVFFTNSDPFEGVAITDK